MHEEPEIETLNRKLQSMHSEMKYYLDYMHVKAYQDALTGVGNTAAYQEKQQVIDERIKAVMYGQIDQDEIPNQ